MVEGDLDGAINIGATMGQKLAKSQGRQGQLHVRWAIQDGIARGVIQKHRMTSMFDLKPPAPKKSKKKAAPPPSE